MENEAAMENYAGLDLSMESTQVCIIDEKGRTLASEKVESSPAAIADMLDRHAPLARAVLETVRMSPAICHGLHELGVPLVYRRQAGPSESQGDEGGQDRSA